MSLVNFVLNLAIIIFIANQRIYETEIEEFKQKWNSHGALTIAFCGFVIGTEALFTIFFLWEACEGKFDESEASYFYLQQCIKPSCQEIV